MLESHAIISILLSGVGESNMHFAKIFVVGPFQRHYVITYFSPINSSAVQIHLYNFTFYPKLEFLWFLFIVGISVSTAIFK